MHASRRLCSREEPVEKVDGRYRHADAEHDSGEHALVPPFAEGEHQTANDDGDEIEALGNRPCEGRFGVAAPRSPKGFRSIAAKGL
jgi:hypothetical protein